MIIPPNPPEIISWASLFFVFPLMLTLLPFWLIARICARQAEKATGTHTGRVFFHTAVLFLGTIFYLALADLARIGLRYLLVEPDWAYTYPQIVQSISARMVVILLTLPLLALSWYKATEKAADTKQAKSQILSRQYLLQFESLVLGAIVVLCLGVGLYHLFNWLLGVGELDWAGLSPTLGYGSVALVFLTGKLYWLSKSP